MNPVNQVLDVLGDVVRAVDGEAVGALHTAGDDRGGVQVRDQAVELVDERRTRRLPDGRRDGDHLEALTRRHEDRPSEAHERRRSRNPVVRPRQPRVGEEPVEATGRGGVRREGRQLRLVARDELPEQLVLGLVVQLVDPLDAIRGHRADGTGDVGDLRLAADGLLRGRSVRPGALRVEAEVGPNANREGHERLVRREEPTGGQVADRDVRALSDEELRPALNRTEHTDVAGAKVARSVDTDEAVVEGLMNALARSDDLGHAFFSL